jgi:hypothetical protein
MVKAGVYLLKEITDYAGTSVRMIEENYCGELRLDTTIFQRHVSKSVNLASPTGFEGDSRNSRHVHHHLTTQQFYNLYIRKRA